MIQPEPAEPVRLLVTGATGFVGAAVASELRTLPGVRPFFALRPGRLDTGGHQLEDLRLGDLADPRTLRGVAEGMDAVLHLASCISGPSELKQAVNADGTQALVEECRRAGVRRIVRLSTASVYGNGPWRGEDIQGLSPRPASSTSRTRLHGDECVLEADGCVVRPHLVHGPGDRWFAPRAMEIVRAVGWVEPESRHSTIHVARLATLLIDLAVDIEGRRGIVLASDEPVGIRDVLDPALEGDGGALRRRTATLQAALVHPAGRTDPRWSHDLHLLGVDHFLTDSLEPLSGGGGV